MEFIMRWFGEGDDSVSLSQIKQIPVISGIAGTLDEIPVGEVWPLDKIENLKNKVNKEGLKLEVIESVNIHEDIKAGLATRDHYIDNYIKTIQNLSKIGIKIICYNFMPIFDWIRTDLYYKLNDGSTTMAYFDEKIKDITPEQLIDEFKRNSAGFSLPGWENEKLKDIEKLFEIFKDVNEERLFKNLEYFLKAVIPECEKLNIKLAIHPDDPPWPIFGLPRIVSTKEQLERIVKCIDSPSNTLAICTGSLGAREDNNIPQIIRHFGEKDKISFVHVRNIKRIGNKRFFETSHMSKEGTLDMIEILKALYEINFNGYLRPDHGRNIWNEKARPGYGLYDRALGVSYLYGMWETLNKIK
ncbi:mannonate dehydratase [Petrotoga sp. 9T1HF07.CasAA.8.2]|uniref:mannonate dehydratase n=1 Tax=Petrotoga sp. 9T1HF07.CasAA.8.2 TaxID=1434329 RepID=UPI000CC3E41C|nr:mannonate dehydratase [Petrotoga sp. 9T1HF07.CasAA.8.2]PNR88193.1 mannonate dehydratase [Petrotoga sp. 9T1HF07.CasAA.8.2]